MSRRADKIRHEAVTLRRKADENGMGHADALAEECGFLMGSVEGLCAQLDAYQGIGAKPQRGCQIAEVHDAAGSFTVEVEYERGQRGKVSGPPEDCYPDEPSSLAIIQVLINGEWIDPFAMIAPSVLERWEETLCAEFDEQDSEA
jgi:hypothetical protein